jgi:nucleoside-diphosphate-sugar epimerase
MNILVTGGAGHLGEALMRTLQAAGHDALDADVLRSPLTCCVGSLTDLGALRSDAAAVLRGAGDV